MVAQGRSYLCKRLDLDRRLAVVCPANLKYYTKVIDHCDISLVANHRAAFLVPVRPDHVSWVPRLLVCPFQTCGVIKAMPRQDRTGIQELLGPNVPCALCDG